MTEKEKRVLLAIPFAKDGAIRRDALARKVGIPDRSVRGIIEDLQNKGYQIVNFQDGEGYFIAETADEVLYYKSQERKRYVTIRDKSRRIKYYPDIRAKVAELRGEMQFGKDTNVPSNIRKEEV